MWRLARAAVGTVQPEARWEPMTWGLLGALRKLGATVQTFASRAVPTGIDAAVRITGRPTRHLDSWVQGRAAALAALHRGAAGCDGAIVCGSFADEAPAGGTLEDLCQWLALPRVAVVDVARLDPCRIPVLTAPVEGILLDRVEDARSRFLWQTTLEALWDAPVLGWLEEKLPARIMAGFLAPAQCPSRELCDELAAALLPTLQCDKLAALAERTSWLPDPVSTWQPAAHARRPVHIAVAYDDAFPCHMPDTLEVLEAGGACVRDFSPLRCERLPEDTDVVFLGTGIEDRHWEELASNCCLQQSLRCFAAAGGRVYAEGTGLAYVSRQVVLADGRRIPMAGLIPTIARRLAAPRCFEPVRLTTGTGSWLFAKLQELRGYGETDWEIIPSGPMLSYARETQSQLDLVGRGNVIGSRAVFHFASHPPVLGRFLAPFAPLHAVAGGRW